MAPALVAAVMGDGARIDIDDEVLPDARQSEIVRELDTAVDRKARRRYNLDQDDGIGDLGRVIGGSWSAADENVGLIHGQIIDSD